VIRAFFINFSVSLLSMVLRSLCYFRFFIPLIIHSTKFPPLFCNVTFWLSCPSLSVYPPLSSLIFLVIVNQPFPPPSSHLTGGSDTLSLSIIHNNFFWTWSLPRHLYVYTSFCPLFFCILLLLSTQQLSYYWSPTFAMYYDNKQKPPPTFFT